MYIQVERLIHEPLFNIVLDVLYYAVITLLQMIGNHCRYTSLRFTFQLGCRPCESV